jgi:uncharacterized protein (TIGR00369 family)
VLDRPLLHLPTTDQPRRSTATPTTQTRVTPPTRALLDLKVNFIRPVPPDGRELLAHGRVRHAGRNITIADAEVVNADGKPVAIATGSAMILAGRPPGLVDPD